MLDPLPPNPDDQPPAPTNARITCEFCQCVLTPTGGAFRHSERARTLRDQEEEIRRLKDALAQIEGASETIKRDLSAAQARIAELTAPATAGGKSSGWL